MFPPNTQQGQPQQQGYNPGPMQQLPTEQVISYPAQDVMQATQPPAPQQLQQGQPQFANGQVQPQFNSAVAQQQFAGQQQSQQQFAPQLPVQQPQVQLPVGQPAPVQQQPVQQPTPQPFGPSNPNHIIQPGPGVPSEFVGRRLGDVYAAVFAARQGQAQQAQQGQQPNQAPVRPTPGQFQQPQQPQQIEQIVRNVVNEAVQQITYPQQVTAAFNRVAALPGFQQVQDRVYQLVGGLDLQQHANPQAWETAYKIAVGERAMQQQAPQQQQQQQQTATQQVQQNQFAQPQMQQQPQPGFNNLNSQQAWQPYPTGQFFSEAPTAQHAPQATIQLTGEQQAIARKFGLTDAQYAAGLTGQFQMPGINR